MCSSEIAASNVVLTLAKPASDNGDSLARIASAFVVPSNAILISLKRLAISLKSAEGSFCCDIKLPLSFRFRAGRPNTVTGDTPSTANGDSRITLRRSSSVVWSGRGWRSSDPDTENSTAGSPPTTPTVFVISTTNGGELTLSAAETLGKAISSGFSFCSAQVSPTIVEIGAEVFTGDSTLGGAVDVDTAFDRDRANAVDPLMHHGRRCANFSRQLGIASEYFRRLLNMWICHSETQRKATLTTCQAMLTMIACSVASWE